MIKVVEAPRFLATLLNEIYVLEGRLEHVPPRAPGKNHPSASQANLRQPSLHTNRRLLRSASGGGGRWRQRPWPP